MLSNRHQLNLMQGELSSTLIENIHTKPHKIESVSIEVILPKRTNIIVMCIYRHPYYNIDDFNKLSKVSPPKVTLIMTF